MVNICVSDEKPKAVTEPTLDEIDAPATEKEEREAEALLKQLSSANADVTDENYYKFKEEKLKKIEALRAEGGNDQHVEELLRLVEETDKLRDEYNAETSGAGDLLSEINELMKGDNADAFDTILSQQVDEILKDNDDLKDLKKLMQDTGAGTLLDITPPADGSVGESDQKPLESPSNDDSDMPDINELMKQVKEMMSQFEEDGSTDALKNAMMAAYEEEEGASSHQDLWAVFPHTLTTLWRFARTFNIQKNRADSTLRLECLLLVSTFLLYAHLLLIGMHLFP